MKRRPCLLAEAQSRGRSTITAWSGLKRQFIRLRSRSRVPRVTSEATADMANNPKKLTDPTDEALTAIQQVLSASDEPHGHPHRRQRRQPAAPPREPARHEARHAPDALRSPKRTCSRRPAHVAADDVRPSQFAANDDRQSIGQILQTPAAAPVQDAPMWSATVFALAWAACGVALGVPLSARSAGGAEARPGRHPGHDRACRLRAAPILFFYVHGLHDVARAGDAHHRPVDGERRHEARRAGRGRPRFRRDASARRSAARSPPWATASSARWRAPPSSKRWSPTKCPRWSAPTTTTKSASAACSRRWRISATRLVGQAEQVRNAITGVHLDLSHDISSVSDHVAGERQRQRAEDRAGADREGRAHHARARPRRRLHDRRARRARRRPARAPGARQPGDRPRHRRRQRPADRRA